MNFKFSFLCFALVVLMFNPVYAEDAVVPTSEADVAETIVVEEIIVDEITIEGREIEACEIDMKQHCRGVTAGENRPIMCLMAYEDQLLDECRVGLLEAAMELEVGVATLDYVYQACSRERSTICGNVNIGEGRLLQCIKANADSISPKCVGALKDTGFWDGVASPEAAQ